MQVFEAWRIPSSPILLATLLACGSSKQTEALAETEAALGEEVSIWSDSTVPGTASDSDTAAVELGLKFRARTAGEVRGVRFYKGSANGGTHIGSLWNTAGQRLATVTFANETASGWQTARFATPVRIEANTVYIASYFAPVGRYAADVGYFAAGGRTAGELYALGNAEGGGNGVYRYNATSAFPSNTFESTNYYVDVVFVSDAPTSGGGTGDGLKGEYYDDVNLSVFKETRVDPRINFNFGLNSPFPSIAPNTFSIRWTGQVLAPASGVYTFATTSDDGVRLWVNNQQVINNWTNHARTTNIGTISLTAGQRYAIRLEYYDQSNEAIIQLAWTPPGATRVIIPQSQLFSGTTTNPNPTPDTTPPSAPPNVAATAASSNSINLSWGASTDNVGVTGYVVARNGAEIAQLASTVRSYNDSGLAASTTYSYTVTARDAAGNVSPASNAASATTHAAPPTGTDPLASLPRVPWEGGPAYYKQFSTLANTEWTTPSFFPIMYWGAYVNEPDKAFNNAAHGINVYGETYAHVTGWQQNVRSAGIWEVGHILPDEADMWAGYGTGTWSGKYGFQPGVCIPENVGCSPDMFKKLEAQRSATDGVMRYYNGGKGMLMWMSLETGAKFINGESWPVSIATGDLYFYTDPNLHGGDPAINGEATTFFGIPRAEVRRAANYGEAAMSKMRVLDALDGTRKPLGVLVELGQQSGEPSGSFAFATMNANKVEGAVWSTLIHEARMVGYFSHAFGTQPTSDALNHPPGDAHYDSIKARIKAINAKVKSLAPVLNTQSYEWQFNTGLSTMLKQHNGVIYIFAMQKRQNTSGTYSFRLPAGINATSVQVVGENRSLPISNGAFSDSFAAEYTHHVYAITL